MLTAKLKDGTRVNVTFDTPRVYGDGSISLNCYFNQHLIAENPLCEKTAFSISSADLLTETSLREILRWARYISKGHSAYFKKLKRGCKLTTYEE